MNIYQPEHSINGHTYLEEDVDCPYREVVNRLKARKVELEKFIKDLKECEEYGNEDGHPGRLRLSPMAGMFEKTELETINRILDVTS